MCKRWPKQQTTPPTWWGSPTNLGPMGRLGGGGARATQTYSYTGRPLPPCAGRCMEGCSALVLPALAPNISLLSRCQLRSSWGRGDELFLMIISSFFFRLTFPAVAGCCPVVLRPFPLPGALGGGDHWSHCYPPCGIDGERASPNSRPPPCGLAALLTAAGSCMLSAPIPGIPKAPLGQWGPW